MNENQIRPETEGVGKFAPACHEKKTAKAEVGNNIHVKKFHINCYVTRKHLPGTIV